MCWARSSHRGRRSGDDPPNHQPTPADGTLTMATTAPGTATGVLLDPVSRVSGPLSVRALVDASNSHIEHAQALATLFRGYEPLLVGRDVRDAVYISSRACGTCGGAHATAAAMAVEMAFELP